jgi:hypothetical protein
VSDGIEINPSRLKRHAEELNNHIVPEVEKARDTLNSINLEGGDFSITGNACAMAYPGALQFAFDDLKTHEEVIQGFAQTIETTAKNWESAEQYSTVKQV